MDNELEQVEQLLKEAAALVVRELEQLPANVNDRWRIRNTGESIQSLLCTLTKSEEQSEIAKLEHCRAVIRGIFYGWSDSPADFRDSIQEPALMKKVFEVYNRCGQLVQLRSQSGES